MQPQTGMWMPCEVPQDCDYSPALCITVTDDAGRYVLRSGNTDALRAVATESGWTNVMVAAFGPDGSFSLATDSIAWAPAGGIRAAGVDDNPNRGRWLTTPADRAAAEEGTFRATAATSIPSISIISAPINATAGALC